jgi:hypothetical protein
MSHLANGVIERNAMNRIKIAHLIPIVLVASLFPYSACKKDSTPEPPVFTPGKRDYAWSSDTLFYLGNAQTTMQSMYASSPTNVYTVGHCEVSGGRMWRFNGARWQTVNLSAIRGYLNAIAGSGANDIWVAGGQAFPIPGSYQNYDSTLIVHFDGAQWSQITGFPRRGGLWCVAAYSATSVWAGGGEGVLYRFNGVSWDLHEVGSQYFFSSIAALNSNEAFAIGHVSDSAPPVDSSGSYLFRFNGTTWQKLDSVMNTPSAPPPHMGTGVYTWGGVLYTIGPNVYRRTGDQWTKLVDAQVGFMSQSSAYNIFAVAQGVWHFNGVDWQEFSQFRTTSFWFDCYTDGQEVFIIGNDNWKTTILHGR